METKTREVCVLQPEVKELVETFILGSGKMFAICLFAMIFVVLKFHTLVYDKMPFSRFANQFDNFQNIITVIITVIKNDILLKKSLPHWSSSNNF